MLKFQEANDNIVILDLNVITIIVKLHQGKTDINEENSEQCFAALFYH